jgi:hypothetical protein
LKIYSFLEDGLLKIYSFSRGRPLVDIQFSRGRPLVDIQFSRGRPLVDIQFSLNGSEIEIVNEFNYLVILLNRIGNFNKAITKQAEKAKQVMYEVSKRGRTHNLSVECQLELFFF